MIAIFYDRKHGCEVTSAQLMAANAVEHYACCNDADDKSRPAVEDLWNASRQIGDLAYKTPACPSYQNWDRYLMTSDLVFLRLEASQMPSQDTRPACDCEGFEPYTHYSYCASVQKTQERSQTSTGHGPADGVGTAADEREGARSEPSPLAARDSGEAAAFDARHPNCTKGWRKGVCWIVKSHAHDCAHPTEHRPPEAADSSRDEPSMPLDEVQEVIAFERKAERARTIEECAAIVDVYARTYGHTSLVDAAATIRDLAAEPFTSAAKEKT